MKSSILFLLARSVKENVIMDYEMNGWTITAISEELRKKNIRSSAAAIAHFQSMANELVLF